MSLYELVALKDNAEDNNAPNNHLAPPKVTWISRLSSTHRRSSMGFSDVQGSSLIDTDDNSNSRGHSPLNLVPKLHPSSSSHVEIETPSPGDAESFFGLSKIAIKDHGQIEVFDHHPAPANGDNPTAAELSSHKITDLVTSAVPMGDFPVATKESLEQLDEMRQRLNNTEATHANYNQEVFQMDPDEPELANHVTLKVPINSHVNEPARKPSKILSKFLQTGAAQNWFFKNEDHELDAGPSPPKSQKIAAFLDDHHDHNATFHTLEGQAAGGKPVSGTAQGFSGLIDKDNEAKRKKESREENLIVPQNF